jgi:hypothetical protein
MFCESQGHRLCDRCRCTLTELMPLSLAAWACRAAGASKINLAAGVGAPSKSNRQLIFSTHNSNIVVNGDADKVIALKSSEPSSNPNVNAPRVRLDCYGAIETQAIRPVITSIMEGGREAFDLRSRKYGYEFN